MTDRYASYNKLKFDYPADRVLRITFSNPKSFNSVDAETHTQMTDIWRDIDRDPDINAVIVTGEGKAFSAGGDFGLIEKMTGNFEEIMKTPPARRCRRRCRRHYLAAAVRHGEGKILPADLQARLRRGSGTHRSCVALRRG